LFSVQSEGTMVTQRLLRRLRVWFAPPSYRFREPLSFRRAAPEMGTLITIRLRPVEAYSGKFPIILVGSRSYGRELMAHYGMDCGTRGSRHRPFRICMSVYGGEYHVRVLSGPRARCDEPRDPGRRGMWQPHTWQPHTWQPHEWQPLPRRRNSHVSGWHCHRLRPGARRAEIVDAA
jgi:hypothetical protein